MLARIPIRVCDASTMPTDQYHEPPDELSAEARTFARVIASLQEEAEAIGWYEQRMSIEENDEARRIMEHAQREEFLHFSMDLEFRTSTLSAISNANEQASSRGMRTYARSRRSVTASQTRRHVRRQDERLRTALVFAIRLILSRSDGGCQRDEIRR